MAEKRNPYAKFQCGVCKKINYFVHKSKNASAKLELKKFCKVCRKHALHKETKK